MLNLSISGTNNKSLVERLPTQKYSTTGSLSFTLSGHSERMPNQLLI